MRKEQKQRLMDKIERELSPTIHSFWKEDTTLCALVTVCEEGFEGNLFEVKKVIKEAKGEHHAR